MIEVHIIISGMVQGVFFRASTKKIADQNNVNGWVRSCPNGTVEIILQGSDSNVQSVIEWCNKGPENANVTDVKVTKQPFSAPYNDFRIMS